MCHRANSEKIRFVMADRGKDNLLESTMKDFQKIWKKANLWNLFPFLKVSTTFGCELKLREKKKIFVIY